jgi:hypothetical protein
MGRSRVGDWRVLRGAVKLRIEGRDFKETCCTIEQNPRDVYQARNLTHTGAVSQVEARSQGGVHASDSEWVHRSGGSGKVLGLSSSHHGLSTCQHAVDKILLR